MRNSMVIVEEITLWNMGSPHSEVVNVLDCDTIVSEFKLQLFCCIHFWENTLKKGVNICNIMAKGFHFIYLAFQFS